MRHFNASSLINADVDIATVSKALGHSSVETTMNIYAHALDEAMSKTCTAIADTLDFSKKTEANENRETAQQNA